MDQDTSLSYGEGLFPWVQLALSEGGVEGKERPREKELG